MKRTMGLELLIVAGLASNLMLIACGGDDDDGKSPSGTGGEAGSTAGTECPAGTAECVADQAGRVCPSDGSDWVPFACGTGETCEDGMCVGACEEGATECASDGLLRVCGSEENWVPVPCEGGTVCEDGACVEEGGTVCTAGETVCATSGAYKTCDNDGSGWVVTACASNETCEDGACGGGVTECTPGETVCATSGAYKTCDDDGSGWVVTACTNNETCEDGACVIDIDGGICDPGTRFCQDDATALTCNDSGNGYTTTECPTGTNCEDGACMGSVCEVGVTQCADFALFSAIEGPGIETSYNPKLLYTCVDGERWVQSECSAGELCSYGMNASAVNEVVMDYLRDPIAYLYGEKTAPQVPTTGAACEPSVCVSQALRAFEDDYGYLERAAPLGEYQTCNDEGDGYLNCEGFPPFSSMRWVEYDCPTGAECGMDYGYFGPEAYCWMDCIPGESWCTEDGVVTCGSDGTPSDPVACTTPNTECEERYGVDESSEALCMHPACSAYYESYYGTYYMDAVGLCTSQTEIRLCDEEGHLADTSTPCEGYCTGFDSNVGGYGYCNQQCEDGAQRCVGNLGVLYQECVGGLWSSQYESCSPGTECIQLGDDTIVCGACEPGEARCNGDDIETCTEEGVWGSAVACEDGVCYEDSYGAHCPEIAPPTCTPGEIQCYGATSEQVCGEDGEWGAPSACATDTYCRIDQQGLDLGCVECVGTIRGNHAWGVVDSTCVEGQLVVCQPDNTWGAGVDCASGSSCEDNYYGSLTGSTTYSTIAACLEDPMDD